MGVWACSAADSSTDNKRKNRIMGMGLGYEDRDSRSRTNAASTFFRTWWHAMRLWSIAPSRRQQPLHPVQQIIRIEWLLQQAIGPRALHGIG